MGSKEVILAESKQNIGLPHPAVSYDEQFGEIIVTEVSTHFDFNLLI